MRRCVPGLEGTPILLRLALRRDRVLVPAWLSVLVLTVIASAAAVKGLYPTSASRVEAADAVNSSPALVAMFGRIYDPTSLGAIAMVKMTAFGGAAVAILAGMITIRHTRTEEEAGRLELLGAAVVGRAAPLTAAIAIGVLTSIGVGALAAAGLIATGLPAAGSVAFGASWFGAGVAFAALAAVAAQISRSSRGATGIFIGVVGLAYVVRAIGDTSNLLSWLTWTSPLGWVHELRAFAGNRWLMLAPLAGFAAVGAAGAFLLAARRDLGAGLLQDRPGPSSAGRFLHGSLGLAWRLECNALLAWTAAFAVLGLVVGGVAGNVGSFLNSSQGQDIIRRLGGEKGLVDAYLAAELGVVGVVIGAYGVHAALRLRSEEDARRTEEVLATGVSRTRWVASHLLVALAGTTCLASTAGFSAGAARAASTGHVADFFDVLGGALVQLPAIWVLIGIVAAGYGIGSRFSRLGWAAFVAFLLLGEIGPILRLPRVVIDLSPFAHVPKLPGSALTTAPLVVLLGVAAVLTTGGFRAFRKRDLT